MMRHGTWGVTMAKSGPQEPYMLVTAAKHIIGLKRIAGGDG